jgi:hypothetical protein
VPTHRIATRWGRPRIGPGGACHGAPFHLFAKPSLGAWNTRRKPAVALEAMDAYPGKTVVLMDVDCRLRGDIEPVTQIDGDVGIVVIARNVRRRRRWAHWLSVECNSRVVVFRPTEGARAFAQTWADTIERSTVNHDIDQRFSAREIGQIADALIEHDSAHDEARRASRGRFKTLLREFERRVLRTGRTRQSRLKGEMSVLVKASA